LCGAIACSHQRHVAVPHCFVLPIPLFPIAFLFFNATATPEIYTLSLHDALPIYGEKVTDPDQVGPAIQRGLEAVRNGSPAVLDIDRKSTRLNSSHEWISYAVFCLKKKKQHG